MKNNYINLLQQAHRLKAKHYRNILIDAIRYAIIMLSFAYFISIYLIESPSASQALQQPIMNSLQVMVLVMQSAFSDALRGSKETSMVMILVSVFAVLSLRNILSIGQSQFLLRMMRDQKACFIEATTYGFKQYRWVHALMLTCVEMFTAALGCIATVVVVMCIGPGWLVLNHVLDGLGAVLVFSTIVAVMFIPYCYVISVSYHTYYLMVDKNISGLALFEYAHTITKSVGFVKTGLLRFRHGIYLLLMVATGMGFVYVINEPMRQSYLGYTLRVALTVLPIWIIAPFKSAMNTILYEQYKEVNPAK